MAPIPGNGSDGGRIDERGVLVSKRYGDVYFADDRHGDPVATGLAQARCVFVEGNDLPTRWARAGDGPFTIGETGFGSGLTFLAAWQAFRQAAPPGATLHYWSAERHPLDARVQRQIVERADPVLGGVFAARYREAMALQDRGTVRIALDGGRVQLTIALDDAETALAGHTFWADAWFLDGFAPARNPAMWSPGLLALVGSRSRPGTTAATWCAAGEVRRGLEAAGFEVARRPGFAGKRHRTTAVLRAPMPAPTPLAPWQLRPRGWHGTRQARVRGAGIAGATAARALAERGFDVTVEAPAAKTPPLPAAVVQPRFAPPDAFGPAWATAGFRFATRFYADLAADGAALRCGVFHPAHDGTVRQEQLARLRAAAPTAGLGHWLDRERTADLALPAGLDIVGGTWIPQGLVVAPALVYDALFDHAGIVRRPPRTTPAADGSLSIVAHGLAALTDPACEWLDLRPVRGQVTALAGDRAPACVLAGGGHLTPTIGPHRWIGATYARGVTSPEATAADHRTNLARLDRLAPGHRAEAVAAWVGVRISTADSVPIVGPLPAPAAFEAAHGAQLRGARVPAGDHPQLEPTLASLGHGSRGFTTTPLTSLLLADVVDGTPLPVDDALAWRLWPARALARAIARR